MPLDIGFSPGRTIEVGDEEIPRPGHFFPEQIQKAFFRSGQHLFGGRGSLTAEALRTELHQHALMLQVVFGDDETILVPTKAGTVTFTDSKKAAVRAALVKDGKPPSFISSHATPDVLKIAAVFWVNKSKRRRKPGEEEAFLSLGEDLARVAAVTLEGENMTRGDALNVARAILDTSMPAAPREIARLQESNPFHASRSMTGLPPTPRKVGRPDLRVVEGGAPAMI